MFTDISEECAISAFMAEDRGSTFLQNIGRCRYLFCISVYSALFHTFNSLGWCETAPSSPA
jgi:hypothetical protein